MDSNIKEKDKTAKDFFSMDRNYAWLFPTLGLDIA